MSEQPTPDELTYKVMHEWCHREVFEARVSAEMRKGWMPIGSVTRIEGEMYDTWTQAMVKL